MTSFSILDNNEKKLKKILNKVFHAFENIMENGAFAPKCLIFHNISKYIVFQRRQKALLYIWNKGLVLRSSP